MSVGERRRIQLVKVENVKVSGGTWGQPSKTRYNYWAEIIKTGGSRTFQNSQSQLGESTRFRIRYNGTFDLSVKWAVVYEGRDYTVQSIDRENEKQFYWIITANTKNG